MLQNGPKLITSTGMAYSDEQVIIVAIDFLDSLAGPLEECLLTDTSPYLSLKEIGTIPGVKD